MMMKRLIPWIAAGMTFASAVFSGCTLREEIGEGGSMDPAQAELILTEEQEAAQDDRAEQTTPALPAEDIADAWAAYEAARDKNATLTALEENQLLYTKRGETDESISLKLNMTQIGTEDVAVAATGSVKTQGSVIPLEIYYWRGVQVRASGDKMTTEAASLDQVLVSVDFLQGIRRDLNRNCITGAVLEESADGTVTLSLTFDGTINGLRTAGRGEIVIDEDGYIVSEGYSFEADGTNGRVSQSVECTLLARNEEVIPADLPENLKY